MDIIDRANDAEQRGRNKGIAAVTDKLKQTGTTDCIDCDTPIPAARRVAYPAATRCVSCQDAHEKKRGATR